VDNTFKRRAPSGRKRKSPFCSADSTEDDVVGDDVHRLQKKEKLAMMEKKREKCRLKFRYLGKHNQTKMYILTFELHLLL